MRWYPPEQCLATTHPELASEWGVGNEFGPDEVLPTSTLEAEWVCRRCGEHFTKRVRARALSTTAAKGCPSCYQALKHTLRTQNGNTLATHYPELVPYWSTRNTLAPSSYTPQSSQQVWWVCEQGHEYECQIAGRVNGRGCPQCRGRQQVSPEYNLAVVYPELLPEWSPHNTLNPYEVAPKSAQSALWVCEVCGNEWESRISHRAEGQSCRACASVGRKLVPGVNDLLTVMPKEAKEWSSRNARSPAMYSYGSFQFVWWQCGVCGEEWETSPAYRNSGHGRCPQCAPPKASVGESEIAELIEGMGFEVIRRDRTIIRPQELDLVVPARGVAVEYNGVYWHSEWNLPSEYHMAKLERCTSAGIRLVQIWEDDWRLRRRVVLRHLAHVLGATAQVEPEAARRVGARRCEVVEVGQDEATVFLELNHLRGTRKGGIRVGLREPEGGLVALVVVNVRQNQAYVERYATSCMVPGGFTRLIRAVERELPQQVTTLVTYADRAISEGELYRNNGWREDLVILPDYSYLVNGVRVHKFNYRKRRFETDPKLQFDPSMTERQLAELNSLPRVYDSGKLRFVKPRHLVG